MDKLKYTKHESKAFPDFKGMRVLILNGAFVSDVVSLFARCGFKTAKGVSDADLVVFTGGSDISPALYGEEEVYNQGFNKARDEFETSVFNAAKEKKIPMFGICRGFQFLAAMHGGKLWQNVSNHGGSHIIYDHQKEVFVQTSSIHHQMLREHEGFSVVATSERIATKFQSQDEDIWVARTTDECPLEIEAGFWKETRSCGVQGHPELYTSYPFFASWTMEFLYDFLAENKTGFENDSPPAFIEAGI